MCRLLPSCDACSDFHEIDPPRWSECPSLVSDIPLGGVDRYVLFGENYIYSEDTMGQHNVQVEPERESGRNRQEMSTG